MQEEQEVIEQVQYESIEAMEAALSGQAEPTPPIETPATVETPTTPVETPAAETPVETPAETPATPAAPAEQSTPPINELEIINRTLGTNYQSLDEVTALKTELAEIPNYKEIKTKFETAPPKPKFATPQIEELNNFTAATNIADLSVLQSMKRHINTEAKDPIEALVIAEIIKDPTLAEDRDMLRKSIQRQYNLEMDEDADPAQEQARVDLEKFNLKREANKANALIDETMGKVKSYTEALPPDTTQETKLKTAADQKLWDETVADNKFKELFKSVEVSVPLGKTSTGVDLGSEVIKYELSAEQQARLDASIKTSISSGLEYSQKNIDTIISAHKNVAILENLDSIIQKAVNSAVAKAELEKEKEIHNPSSAKVEVPIPNTEAMNEKQKLEHYVMTGKIIE